MKTFVKQIALVLAAGSLTVFAATAQARGNADNGKELVSKKYACASCHGGEFNKPIDDSYPKLAGQKYDYLVHALTAYKNSDNPVIGRNNAIMSGQAKPLSNEEISDIASYLSSLPESVVTHK